jgi:hypothetical protein
MVTDLARVYIPLLRNSATWILQLQDVTCVIRTNKMHTFFVNDLIQLYCLQHVSNNEAFILGRTVHAVFACTSLPEDEQTCRRQYN